MHTGTEPKAFFDDVSVVLQAVRIVNVVLESYSYSPFAAIDEMM